MLGIWGTPQNAFGSLHTHKNSTPACASVLFLRVLLSYPGGDTLSDERIEKAITQNGARLIILDPIQAYMGEKTDMNRANEVRPMFRRLADVAERTGCAVILIGHLNKAAGGQSAYRGLGSIHQPQQLGAGAPFIIPGNLTLVLY